MRGRAILIGALLASAGATTPAAAHGGGDHAAGERFPPLPPASGASAHARPTGSAVSDRSLERRVRRIEQTALGRDHAVEHAEGRYELRRAQAAHDVVPQTGRYTQVLQPDNGLVPPQVGGQWQASQPLPIVAINAVQLHTGKILYFAYPWRATEPDPDDPNAAYANGTPEQLSQWNYADAYLYDPATGQSTEVAPPIDEETGRPVELFCAGQSLLADGRVLITGGNVGNPAGTGNSKANHGLNTTYVFDPDKAERGENAWTTGPRMRQGRWYPTQLLLGDGRTVIISGQANGLGRRNAAGQLVAPPDPDAGLVNRDVDVYYPDALGGTLENLAGSRLDGAGGRPDNVGQYPHMSLTPSGDIHVFGPFKPDNWLMRLPVGGAANPNARFDKLAPLAPNHRQWAGGFQVPGGTAGSSKVMLVGGADRTDLPPDNRANAGALATTSFYDEARPGEGWQTGPALNTARAFANTVLLPTGKVAVVGGGLGDFSTTRYYRWTFNGGARPAGTVDQRRVEILDPKAPASAPAVLGNAQAEGRTYHSTALLLPDGRVWSAGDDINGPRAVPDPQGSGGGPAHDQALQQGGGSGVRTDTAEIWSPPYLFEADGSPAARPQVVQAPASIPYGSRFGVRTRGEASKAVLVAAGATTHAVDMSQRLVTLADPDQVGGRGVNLEAPSNANIAPPGWYMLFVLDADGTPSTAAWVRIGPAAGRAATLSSSDAPTDPDAAPAPPGVVSPPTTPTGTGATTKRLKLNVRLALPTTRERLLKAKRFSAVVTTDRPATVTFAAGQEAKRLVKVKGKRKRVRRTVAVPLAKAKRTTLRRAGARRVRVTLSAAAVKRLRASRTATLRIVVTAKPREGGKAVRIVRRPVLR